MKHIYYIFIFSILASCSSIKQAEKSMNSGDYLKAYDLLIEEYQKGVSEKKKERFLPMFQNAYMKMVASQESRIEQLKSAKNPAYTGDIYTTLVGLHKRQEQLRRFLPIYHKGKEMLFKTKNYLPAVDQAKNDYVAYLYQGSLKKLDSQNKQDIRNAHGELRKIQQLIPGYNDVENLLKEAHYLGTDFVLIQIENRSNQLLPRRLEEDLTQISTYGLNNFWTEYHQKKQNDYTYDYLIKMDIEHIMVSPERMNTRQHQFEREIIDGWEYLYENGRKVLDSLGKPIKVDKIILVSARVEEVIQEKDALVQGRVDLIDLSNNQIIDSQKLHSEYGFRNHFAKFFGDRRALDDHMQKLSYNQFTPFPSHEQMVFDSGEEIKAQLKRLLKRRFK